jgi:4-diphosphocytidyl-2-C-methyl-D-erythritol kinase
MQLGKTIGADIPFCIKGGTMLAEGIGELLTDIKPLSNVDIVLVKPKISVSTAWVYKNLNIEKITSRPHTDYIISMIEKRDLQNLCNKMVNVLESVTIKKYEIICEIKEKLVKLGALGSMMSGSGPTVFGIFENRLTAQKAYENINRDDRWNCILTETYYEER